MSASARALCLLLSLSCLLAGVYSAFSHPVAPLGVSLVFVGVLVLLQWQFRLAIFLLPALLPILNFSPWTGWLIVDEFDLLMLAVLAAGYFRLQFDACDLAPGRAFLLLLALVALLLVRCASGLSLPDLSWYANYSTPLNGFRVGKSLLWSVLLIPLFARLVDAWPAHVAARHFFVSCLIGSCGVVLAVLWERAFHPGLFDISTPYRTVALFWEMHLGGAALDAYLVLIAPVLVWAWRSAISLRGRLLVGALIVVFTYVALTTFSRGVIAAIAGSLVLLGALLAWRRFAGVRAARVIRFSSVLVLFLVVLEIALVLGTDSFMNKRLATSEQDFGGRLRHWEQGVGLLKTPGEWLFGLGLGQLPAAMTKDPAGPVLPGKFYWREDDAGRPSLVIEGADGRYDGREVGHLFALAQRVDLVARQRYRFSLDMRSDTDVDLLVQVCAEHLLYPARCQYRKIRLRSGDWQHWQSSLSGFPFSVDSWQGIAHGVFLLSVLMPGTKVELSSLILTAGNGNLLRNSRFEAREAGWFPSAHSYFLPWHIDNLYLEVLIEAGVLGLLCFLAGLCWILRRLFRAFMAGNDQAPYLIASIAGLLALGLVVSVFDMPRVATLFGLFLVFAWRNTCDESISLPNPKPRLRDLPG